MKIVDRYKATNDDFNNGRIFAAKSFGDISSSYPSLVEDMSTFEKLQEISDGFVVFADGVVEGGISNLKGLKDAILNLPNLDTRVIRERAYQLSSDTIKYLTDSRYRDSINQEAVYDLKADIAYGQILALQGDADKIGQVVGEATGNLVADLAISATTVGVGKAVTAGSAISKKLLKYIELSNKINSDNNGIETAIKAVECSFHGDMQVKTRSGYQAIRSIKPYDWVFAKNEITGKTSYRQVLQTINSIDPDTTRITIVNSDGVKQTIISDGLHPYFVDFTGDMTPPKPSTGHSYKGNLTHAYWVGAKDIEIGHRLIDDKGNYQTVIAIHTEQTPLDSYNLEVDTDHTFFIKGIDGVESVWVHNKNCWHSIPADVKKTQIGNDTVYEFEDNGRTVKVIENPEFSEKGGAKFFEVKVTGRGNNQKVVVIKDNKPNITSDVNSNTIVVQRGEKGNWNQYLNKPEPNKRIVIEETGHIYHTDSLSRVSLVEADLRKLENDRNTNQQCKSGGCDRLPTDHGGHLIASMFDGLGEGINIVPMDAKFNGSGGEWYKMEARWKNTLENNGTVQVKIEPIYSGDSKRPYRFVIYEKINNGQENIIRLKNTETGN